MAASHAPAIVKVLWDIENIKCDSPKLKRALRAFLEASGLNFVGDRMDIVAYHDPRMTSGIPVATVDTLVTTPVTLIDKGSKKGLTDHCLARDCRNIVQDVDRFGLRVRCVVIVSSDSDYSAAGIYDAVNDSGIHLVVVHDDNIKRQLLDGSSDLRLFIHLMDLLAWLPPSPPNAVLPPSSSLLGSGSSPRHTMLEAGIQFGQLAITDSPSNTQPATNGTQSAADTPSSPSAPTMHADVAGGRRASIVSLDTSELPQAELNLEVFSQAVLAAVNSRGGNTLGSQLGAVLRRSFNYSKLLPLLNQCTGVQVKRRPEGGDFSVVLADTAL